MPVPAVVFCQGALNTPAGATAHVLLRRSERFRVLAVIDERFAGRDAGEVVDGCSTGIPVVGDVESAVASARGNGNGPSHLVLAVSYQPGGIPGPARTEVIRALELGLHVVSALHDSLADDPELSRLAREHDLNITDLRRHLGGLGQCSVKGRLSEVEARRVAVLGTDVGVGKLTTCWALVDALHATGTTAEMVGTSAAAWLTGVANTVIADSVIHGFARVEIEHAIWLAWRQSHPRAIVVQGCGGLLSPAHPGGLEVIAGARPDCIVLQHAPGRRYYEDMEGFPIHAIERQIAVVEMIAGRRVVAVALSGEDFSFENAARARGRIESETGLPAVDPLRDGVDDIVEAVLPYVRG
jgi:uncharacterized NAD-dependent epimerase/dehydratase family protein